MSNYQVLHDEIDAALIESAPLGWRIAPDICFREPSGNGSCVYYHRVWQYLLLLGVTTSMRTDSGFLVENLRTALRATRNSRILICGAADYGLLAHVLWAAQLESAKPEITVLDRCDTPLALNRWYAERQSATVATVCANILDWQGTQPFDVVCTHSFLGWFSPSERRTLVDSWCQLLRPGGVVITTKRLRDTPPNEAHQKFTTSEAAAFARRVGVLASEQHGRIGTTEPVALVNAALAYARGHVRYPMRHRDEVTALFDQGGFSIETLDGNAPEFGGDRPSGPVRGAGPRLRIVARRRGKPIQS